MRVLVLNGYASDDPDSQVTEAAVASLQAKGHTTDLLDLHTYNKVMSAEERAAYHSDVPVVSEDVRDSADRLRKAQSMLFCYPTLTFTVPASVKGWLERVLVPGVAFVFDEKHRVRPGMTNIRRVGAITTSPHGRIARLRARDSGRRTTARTLRLSCHSRCRVTFLSLPTPLNEHAPTRIRRALRRW